MWKDHFEKLYNAKKDSKYRSVLERKLLDTLPTHGGPAISVTDLYKTLSNQKCKKAPGPDRLHIEAYKFAGPRLCVLLSILFDMFIQYSYVPHPLCESIIVPLVKCKPANLSDVNNYRAIALSNTISKNRSSLMR